MSTNVKAKVDAAAADIDFDKNDYVVELSTTKGPIRLTFYPEVAPGHAKNFIALSKIGFYNGLTFHRVIGGFMIQGGCPLGTGTGSGGYNVKAEFNKKPHVAGVLSMARSQHPDSAGSQFFICLGAHSYLDGQYTAFGQVVDDDSMNTVKAIGGVKTDRSDKPVDKMEIKSATVTATPKS